MVISDGSSDVCSSDLLSYEGQSLSLPNVANWGGRIGFDYRAPVGGEMRFQLSGSARYVGKSRLGVGPLPGRERSDKCRARTEGDSTVGSRWGRWHYKKKT